MQHNIYELDATIADQYVAFELILSRIGFCNNVSDFFKYEPRDGGRGCLITDALSVVLGAMIRRNRNSWLLANNPSPNFKPRKADRTRTETLPVALGCFWSHHFRGLTVAGLMSETSAGRSAFYQCFHDPYDLSEQMRRGLESDILDVSAPWFQGERDPRKLLQQSLEGLVNI